MKYLILLPVVWIGLVFLSRWLSVTLSVQVMRHDVKSLDACCGWIVYGSVVTMGVGIATQIKTDSEKLAMLSGLITAVVVSAALLTFNRWPSKSKKLQAFRRERKLGIVKYGDQVDELLPRSVFIISGPI